MKNKINNETEILIDSLLNYYDVLSVVELAVYLGIEPQNISKWKARNSINAIKKKCRELNIYDQIFDENTNNKILSSANNIKINDKLFESISDLASTYGVSIDSFIESILINELRREDRLR